MTELDTESIWGTSLDTTRFGKIGVRIAEVLNFKIMQDATSQITSTAVLPILEQISEEVLLDLIAAAKGSDAVIPYEFITANFGDSMTKVLWRWRVEIKEMKKILSRHKSIEIVTRTL